jgi:protein TonB
VAVTGPAPVSPPAVTAPAPTAPDPEAATAVTPPRFDVVLLDNPKPDYPLMARRLGVQGTVRLRVFVSAGGLPERVELNESSGSSVLDRTAEQAVKRWRFVPAMRGEVAVAEWVVVPVKFTLKE